MKPTKNIKKIIQESYLKNPDIPASDDTDRRILSDALSTMENFKRTRPIGSGTIIGRFLMKNKIAKITTAVVLVAAILFSISVLDKSNPVWAIDRTIETLREIESIHVFGYFLTADAKKADFQAWIIPSLEDSSKAAYSRFEAGRFEPGDFDPNDPNRHVVVVSEKENSTTVYFPENAWTFYPNQRIAYISEGLDRSSQDPPCLGSDFFEEMKNKAQNWHEDYGKDELTGKNSVFVTCTHPSRIGANYWWIQFDVESTLPVRSKLYWNQDYTGEPAASFEAVTYNPKLPEGVFEFHAPEGTKILDHRVLSDIVNINPTYGIDVNELDTEEACKKIVSEYWEAVINQDWQKASRMRPLIGEQEWADLQNMYMTVKPAISLGIRECINMDNKASFPIVPCLIRMQNGMTQAGVLQVSIEQVGNEKRGVIVDSLGPEFVDLP